MISVKVDVTKLDKAEFHKGEKGTYADLILMENREGKDQYGNDGFVVQGVSKASREAGKRGPIVGNFRRFGNGSTPTKPKQTPAPKPVEGPNDDVPF